MSDLRRPLTLLPILMLCIAPAAALDWIEQASRPGADLPPRGQSRFDQLFALEHGGYRIPYPFDRLAAELEAKLDNGANPAVRRTFVPMGRSLQRDAPAPDYFRYPREIIALEGESPVAGSRAGLVYEYRLFIAHQPKTETLEVISYNDAAGRFEFQLVDDYAAGKSPRVRAASRLMCMSCHHNAGPIFPRTPWRETSFNTEVARRLAEALPALFESPIDLLSLDAGVIDVLAERANYLSAAQTIWRYGCASIECRAAMLRAVLQYRLSGKSSFDWNSADYLRHYRDELVQTWARRWPLGLALAGSRLSDRDPFADDAGDARHDPLRPRPAQAVWHGVDTALARGIVFRLAGFFTAADIRRLDRALQAKRLEQPVPVLAFTAGCSASHRRDRVYQLKCGEDNDIDRLQASIEIDPDHPGSADIQSLRLPRDTNLLQPQVASLRQLERGLRIEPRHGAGLSSRLANGDRLEAVTLTWRDSPLGATTEIEVRVVAESEILESALARLLESQRRGEADSLSAGVFRRRALLQELTPLLALPQLDWPPMVAQPPQPTPPDRALEIGGRLALLQPYCAPCHADDSRQPPGFLAGADAAARVARCAPRMLRRLLAWQNDEATSPAPMPPPQSLAFIGVEAKQWPHSDHYRGLVDELEKLLHKRASSDWKSLEYAALPACMAAGP